MSIGHGYDPRFYEVSLFFSFPALSRDAQTAYQTSVAALLKPFTKILLYHIFRRNCVKNTLLFVFYVYSAYHSMFNGAKGGLKVSALRLKADETASFPAFSAGAVSEQLYSTQKKLSTQKYWSNILEYSNFFHINHKANV